MSRSERFWMAVFIFDIIFGTVALLTGMWKDERGENEGPQITAQDSDTSGV